MFQEPCIFDAEEEDVDALSALHVLSAEEEGFELRSSSGDATDAADADAGTLAKLSHSFAISQASNVSNGLHCAAEAFRLLAGVPGCSKEIGTP